MFNDDEDQLLSGAYNLGRDHFKFGWAMANERLFKDWSPAEIDAYYRGYEEAEQ